MEDPLPRQLMLQLILILANAFFACTEIAVISLNDNKLKKAAEEGNRPAQRLVSLTDPPSRFLATIQVGITLAGFLASAFAASSFSGRLAAWLLGLGLPLSIQSLETISLVIITLVLSYFTLVFGELVPKRIAMQHPDKIAMAFAGSIYFLAKLTAPLVWLLTASTNAVLRLLRIDIHKEPAQVTEEEIRMMVDLGEEKGTIEPDEGIMIDNVLELSSRTAVELMTHRIDLTVLWAEDTQEQWAQTICISNHSRYPVCGEDIDDMIGILHVRDFFCNERAPQPRDKAQIVRPAYFVPETAAADVLFREMKRNKTHMAVVVDEYGGVSGVITMEDLLEQIVGQIEDEHDQEEPEITTVGENVWRVRGSISISDLSDELSVEFPEGDYETLGGLIFAQMNFIPDDGANPEVNVAGLHIVVEELCDHRVEWARISAQPPEPGTLEPE